MTIVFVHGGVSGTRVGPATDLGPSVAAGCAQGRALDAVEQAVRVLEDDPALNAGWGSVLHKEGGLELDAGIAEGRPYRAAGVANVDLRHPISLARIVLERTPHVLITGAGAQALGLSHGLTRLERSTQEQHERWELAHSNEELDAEAFGKPEHVDTVGAVALDDHGTLAAASSTGGVFGKLPGRVGDAPVFGAGFYADERVAVVGTGVGESFLLTLACRRVAEAVARGSEVQSACEEVIGTIQEQDPSPSDASPIAAGLLALDARGSCGAAFTGASLQIEGPAGPLDAVRLG